MMDKVSALQYQRLRAKIWKISEESVDWTGFIINQSNSEPASASTELLCQLTLVVVKRAAGWKHCPKAYLCKG